MDDFESHNNDDIACRVCLYLQHLGMYSKYISFPCNFCRAFDDFISKECGKTNDCKIMWDNLLRRIVYVQSELITQKRQLIALQHQMQEFDAVVHLEQEQFASKRHGDT